MYKYIYTFILTSPYEPYKISTNDSPSGYIVELVCSLL